MGYPIINLAADMAMGYSIIILAGDMVMDYTIIKLDYSTPSFVTLCWRDIQISSPGH